MKVWIQDDIQKDIKICIKKGWRSLDKELVFVLRLLKIDGSMPGEESFQYVKEELCGNTLHARIALPSDGVGQSKGARIIYYRNNEEVKILYVGGHKDRRYNNSSLMCDLLLDRFKSRLFKEFEDTD